MTEQQHDDHVLAEAYDRLDRATAPADVQASVAARLRTRRLRRRAGAGLAAAAVVAGVAGVAVLGPGGDDVAVDVPVAGAGSGPESTLTVSFADGTSYAFDDVTVTCDPAEVPGGAGGPGDRIWAFSPQLIGAGDRLEQPFLYIDLRVDEIADGDVLRVPVDGDLASERQRAVLFVAAETGGPRANEGSSAQLDSSGTVTVVRASCAGDPVLELDVDAVLGSEVEQEQMELSGTLR